VTLPLTCACVCVSYSKLSIAYPAIGRLAQLEQYSPTKTARLTQRQREQATTMV